MRPLGNSIGVWANPMQRLWGDDGDQVSFNALESSDQDCSEHHQHQTQDIRGEDITSYSAYKGICKNKLRTLIQQFTGTRCLLNSNCMPQFPILEVGSEC